MSFRNQRPESRSVRRQNRGANTDFRPTRMDLPGPLRIMTNPKVFVTMGIIFAGAIIVSLFSGAIGIGTTPVTGEDQFGQMNTLEDVPRNNDGDGSSTAAPTPIPVKRYTSAPALAIDTTKTYKATITTNKGVIEMELYPDAAPQAVNAFVFLAQDGYYDGTTFLELVKDQSGSKFYTQAGDPTKTGLGTPGFSIKKELTTRPFARGAVGMGGSSSTSNGGQFFISFGDYPALNGKYTIFGQVTSGLDVLDKLTLLNVTDASGGSSTGDTIESIEIVAE
jgi:cyclophilin family peptidyl-prolyl cis-trans isomerase